MTDDSMTIAQLEEAAATALRGAMAAQTWAVDPLADPESRAAWAKALVANVKLHRRLHSEIERLRKLHSEIERLRKLGVTSNGIQDRPASAEPRDA
ncbi:MAG TPA: hypothetical protein PKV96_03450 [Candidatus Saccharimonas sp.]|nr:hypothetical protein [Candidatus Saccharimonas sp.]